MDTILKWIPLLSLALVSKLSFAGDIPATTIYDRAERGVAGFGYVGAGHGQDVKGSVHKYDIDRMVVSRTGTRLNVNIYTSFYNDIGYNNIVMGDLFMAADPNDSQPWRPATSRWSRYQTDRYASTGSTTGTNWNYAYNLSNRDRAKKNGYGRLVTGFNHNDLRDSNSSSNRHHQAVSLRNNSGHQVAGQGGWNRWSVSRGAVERRNGVYYGLVNFNFDVAGTALESANQIAFRWAMSCANDIIEGMVSHRANKPPVNVPEPKTWVLLLLGILAITYKRNQLVK